MPDSLTHQHHTHHDTVTDAGISAIHPARQDTLHDTVLRDTLDTVPLDTLDSIAPQPVVLATPPPPPQPPAWHTGITPEPRPDSPSHNPTIITIFLALFIIVALTMRQTRHTLKKTRRDLTAARPRPNPIDDHTPADHRIVATLHIQLIVFAALLTQTLLRHTLAIAEWSHTLTLILIAIFTAHITVTQILYRIAAATFAPNPPAASRLIRSLNASQVYTGFALTIPTLLAVFWPETTQLALLAAITLAVAIRLMFITTAFRIFYTNFTSIIYNFLYLCTLEIVPIVITCRIILHTTAP